MFSPREIADKTGFHEKTIRRAINRGELRGSLLCGKLRVARTDYLAWVTAGVVQPECPAVVGTVDTAPHQVRAVSTVQRYGLRQRAAASLSTTTPKGARR